MNGRPAERLLHAILARFEDVRGPDGHGNFRVRCPWHADHNPSLDIHLNGFLCRACNVSGGLMDLAAAIGVTTVYRYTDADGGPLYEVHRFPPGTLDTGKTFRVRSADGRWGLNGAKRVLYHLPEVLAAVKAGQTVYVCEGEKDVDNLAAAGLTATTNDGGAGKWRAEFSEVLRGARVVILPDNDEPGREHAEQIARALSGIAAEVRVLMLPGLPPKGDVSDWFSAGHTAEELREQAAAAPVWTPSEATVQPPQAAGTNRIVLVPWPAINEPDDRPQWIIENIAAAGAVSAIAGRPRVGKSVLARQACVCVEQGQPFLGLRVERGRSVYILTAFSEGRASTAKEHFAALGAPVDGPLFARLSNFDPRCDFAELAELVLAAGARLVVFDTLRGVTGGVDLNDYAKASLAMEPLWKLAEATKAAVLTIHHQGRRNDIGDDLSLGMLGSTGLAASCDTFGLLTFGESGLRKLETRSRDADDFSVHLDFDGTSYRPIAPPEEAKASRDYAAVLQALRDFGDWASSRQLSDKLSLSERTVRRILKNAAQRGDCEHNMQGGAFSRYRAAPIPASISLSNLKGGDAVRNPDP